MTNGLALLSAFRYNNKFKNYQFKYQKRNMLSRQNRNTHT